MEVRQTKGNSGTFATRPLSRGERIIAEKPIFVTLEVLKGNDPSIERDVSKLPEDQKQKFYKLYDCWNPQHPTYSGIVLTNGLPLGKDSKEIGVFPTIARLNHSCLPNAHYAWNEKLSMGTVHVTKQIKKGDEICISYIDLYNDFNIRSKLLEKNFNFKITRSEGEVSTEYSISDVRRRRLSILDKDIIPTVAQRNPLLAMAAVKESLDLLVKEDIHEPALEARLYYDAYQLCRKDYTLGNAKMWAQKAYEAFLVSDGPDNPSTTLKMKELAS